MSEAITLRKTLVAVAAAAVAGGAFAAELGSLMVYSAVGEPLNAELTIRDVDPKAEQLMVRLAPASTYRRVGKEVSLSLNDISLTLLKKEPYTVKIKGQQAVSAQQFPLIVELSEAGKLSAKLYEVRLQDRPTAPMVKEAEAAKKPAPIVDASTKEKSVVPSAGTGATTPAEPSKTLSTVPSAKPAAVKKASTEPAYVPPVREPVHSTAKSTAPKQSVQSAKPAPRATAAGPVKLPLNPADYDLDQPFLVRDGMTMWSIATLYRPRYPQASMDQILVAFVRANPGAYEKGRVNGVKVGSRLKAPLADDVAAVELDEAWALVRVAPNADARKAPSQKVLQRAHKRMQKESPALWRKWKAEHPESAKPAPKAPTKPVKAEKKPEAQPLPTPTPKSEPVADPLAATIAQADAQHNAKLQAETVPAEQTAPVEKTPETPAAEPAVKPEPETKPAPTPVPAMPALDEKSEEESGGFWGALVGFLVLLAAAAGGAWFWMKQRKATFRRKEESMGVVKFRKAEAAKPEQLQGTQEMLDRRLESERATQRMQAAQAARTEPKLGEIKPQAPAAGFNVATAYVDEESQAQPASVGGTSAETLSGKLITARTYMGVGAYAEAQRVLHEVLLAGNEEQRRHASELLSQIEEKTRGGQQ